MSRDLVDQLARDDNLRDRLSRPQADFIFRYPTFWLPDNREFLYHRFQRMATPSLDPETGITTIEANAFTPADAQAVAQAMLDHAEALLNRMNERFYQSQIAAADRFLAETQKGLDAIEAELKDFRKRSGSIDPSLVAKSKLAVIQGLSAQLAQVEASIAQQLKLAPTVPALAGLRAQAHSYSDEIEKQMLEIAGATDSEAVKLQTYDQLMLRRDFALTALANAVAQRDLARQDAERQHLYVQVVSKPSLPLDWARYPQTTLDLLMLFAICLGAFQLLRKLRNVALEHRP
jgi:capsular polysaccharide transport system permease protein